MRRTILTVALAALITGSAAWSQEATPPKQKYPVAWATLLNVDQQKMQLTALVTQDGSSKKGDRGESRVIIYTLTVDTSVRISTGPDTSELGTLDDLKPQMPLLISYKPAEKEGELHAAIYIKVRWKDPNKQPKP